MAQKSKIEWTDRTWNPVRGCTHVSEGCRHCYAERMAARFSAPGLAYEGIAQMTSAGPRWTNKIVLVNDILQQPLRWSRSYMVFVNSMGDLFHESVPTEFIKSVFEVMSKAQQHRFQILTKRSERLLRLDKELSWFDNIWMGVTMEDAPYLDRIDHLRQTSAIVKFLSLEPLLGPLPELNLTGIHWVIVGGESGPEARPMNKEWVLDIRAQCIRAGVPFFFKQWGGVNKKKFGRLLEGKAWDGMPG